jgi:hypothetical protein
MIFNSRSLFFVVLLSAMGAGIAYAQPEPRGKGSYKFYTKTQIEVVKDDKGQPYEYKIVKGKNTVFEYTFIAADDSMIADDEYREAIVFEIEGTSKKSFRFTAAELRKIKCFYYWACFCPNAGSHLVEKGQISGQRYGKKKWLVSLEVSIASPEFPAWPKEKQILRQYFMRSTFKQQ